MLALTPTIEPQTGTNNVWDGRWTMGHGFLLEMGGLELHQHGRPPEIIVGNRHKDGSQNNSTRYYALFEHNPSRRVVDQIRMISPQQIQDKSKGGFIVSLLVILQTTWFFMQCCARMTTKLLLTQLEALSLAFAAVNVFTSIIWWYKPRNMQVPIPIHLDEEQERPRRADGRRTAPRRNGNRRDSVENAGELIEIGIPNATPLSTLEAEQAASQPPPENSPIKSIRECITALRKGARKGWQSSERHAGVFVALLGVFLFMGTIFLYIFFQLFPLSSSVSSFPTSSERELWELTAIYACGLPLTVLSASGAVFFALYPICFLVHFIIPNPRRETWKQRTETWSLMYGLGAGVVLYFLARILIVVLAFTTLRNIPQGAYQQIEWLTFFPHFT